MSGQADVVGPGVAGNGVVAPVGGVGLGVHRQEGRFVAKGLDGFPGHHTVPVIGDDDDIVVGHGRLQHGAQFTVLLRAYFVVIDVIYLEELLQKVPLDEAPLDDGGRARLAEEHGFDVAGQFLPHEVFLGIL